MADDSDLRKQRADALRQKIEQMKRGGAPSAPPPSGASTAPPGPASESPNEFVQRRMRELSGGPPSPKKKPTK